MIQLSSSDWISLASIFVDLLAIVVGAFIAIWVVEKIQSKQESRKVLKDYFASEIINLRNSYRAIISEIYSQKMKPKEFKNRMSLLGIQATDLVSNIKNVFEIEGGIIEYQVELNVLVSNDETYNSCYKRNSAVTFSEAFIASLKKFDADNSGVFNNLLIKIYES